jgi:hypothetical protein
MRLGDRIYRSERQGVITMTVPEHELRELVATWRDREQLLCRRADQQHGTQYAEQLAYRADGIGGCADALEALLELPRTVVAVDPSLQSEGKPSTRA